MALTYLLMSEEVKAIKRLGDSEVIALDETDKKKLELLKKALSESKSSKKAHMLRGQGILTLKWEWVMRFNLRLR